MPGDGLTLCPIKEVLVKQLLAAIIILYLLGYLSL